MLPAGPLRQLARKACCLDSFTCMFALCTKVCLQSAGVLACEFDPIATFQHPFMLSYVIGVIDPCARCQLSRQGAEFALLTNRHKRFDHRIRNTLGTCCPVSPL